MCALLPISHSPEWEVKPHRKLLLRQIQLLAQRPHGRHTASTRELGLGRWRSIRVRNSGSDVPAILAQWDELCERIFYLEYRIENIDGSGVDVPQKAAAIYMITQTRQLLDHQPISDVTVLMVLKLMLRGLIREHADVAAKDCESPICTMPFYAA